MLDKQFAKQKYCLQSKVFWPSLLVLAVASNFANAQPPSGRAVKILQNQGIVKVMPLRGGTKYKTGFQNRIPTNYQRRIASRMPVNTKGMVRAKFSISTRKYG